MSTFWTSLRFCGSPSFQWLYFYAQSAKGFKNVFFSSWGILLIKCCLERAKANNITTGWFSSFILERKTLHLILEQCGKGESMQLRNTIQMSVTLIIVTFKSKRKQSEKFTKIIFVGSISINAYFPAILLREIIFLVLCASTCRNCSFNNEDSSPLCSQQDPDCFWHMISVF